MYRLNNTDQTNLFIPLIVFKYSPINHRNLNFQYILYPKQCHHPIAPEIPPLFLMTTLQHRSFLRFCRIHKNTHTLKTTNIYHKNITQFNQFILQKLDTKSQDNNPKSEKEESKTQKLKKANHLNFIFLGRSIGSKIPRKLQHAQGQMNLQQKYSRTLQSSIRIQIITGSSNIIVNQRGELSHRGQGV